jgi:hypothetical protein
MRKSKVSFKLLVLAGILVLTFSCATSPYKKLSTSNVQNVTYIEPGIKTVLLPIIISYESVYNESRIDPGQEGEQVRSLLETSAAAFFNSKNLSLTSVSQVNAGIEQLNDELKRVIASSAALFKAFPGDQTVNAVKDFGRETGVGAILLLACEVKVGTLGTWNSYSGAITSKNDRTIFKSVLINTADGSKLWSNDVQLRKLPQLGTRDFTDAINSIFTNLKLKGE